MNYTAQYNYYLAMTPKKLRAKFSDWLRWRNSQAIRRMNTLDW